MNNETSKAVASDHNLDVARDEQPLANASPTANTTLISVEIEAKVASDGKCNVFSDGEFESSVSVAAQPEYPQTDAGQMVSAGDKPSNFCEEKPLGEIRTGAEKGSEPASYDNGNFPNGEQPGSSIYLTAELEETSVRGGPTAVAGNKPSDIGVESGVNFAEEIPSRAGPSAETVPSSIAESSAPPIESSQMMEANIIQSDGPLPITTTLEDVGMAVDSNTTSENDDDSAIVRPQSSTQSLRESVVQYVEENGRTYHAYNSGKYNLPNDEAEQERLDLQHHLFLLSLDGALGLAPLDPKTTHNVMDIGTGTGIWAIEFADRYPSASVLGTDLSPIQPAFVPPNCRFEVSDAEEEWHFNEKFDYIHARAMAACFDNPANVVSSAFSVLSSNGIFEIQDAQLPLRCVDTTMDGTDLQKWSDLMIESATKLGRNPKNSQNYGMYMEAAGFVDIVERHVYWPLNTWPQGQKEKTLGMWTQQNLLDGINGMSMAFFTRGAGWSKEEVEVFLAGVRKDIKNRHIHSYIDVIIFYGRKPAL